ncbi:cell division protein ZapC [Photobacterium sp. WH77]|uniref:Cell division protein ZapC n=1 Tax=Photobacterium arenosum TaxID=2774143 RepID=A0ABR9BPF6_9GAMM|nr:MULTISPECIES: cell division protein ZapC [Photobacterium]MBV7263269.1 cell division protein ZapC [Photobacterium sp. WH24]MCG2837342.1 cell division protein ZapC [Photobacterium sp. WH77]MCG2845088.1 cell division protein ZapC [Photobacterium sp. WH80]MBD8514449.1 cell division protein ZapC [Photobacterium arenosum]MDO6580598.1 cell division protein ZapC [Photobacterium sp. 2_MG-2023]
MLKPNNSWTWYYDQKNDSLMLDLGEEMVFRVSIPSKHLIACAFNRCEFTVDDASTYQTYLENISALDLSAPRKVELALNAVAASRFHKPMMPKSWFFSQQEGGYTPHNGEIIGLDTDFGSARYLVIENSGCASLCMLADVESHVLTSGKEMEFCGIIKVMNDRMQAVHLDTELGLALVG